MNTLKKLVLISIALLLIIPAFSQNPFIRSMYSADPSGRVFNDTLYVYPSHDLDTARRFSMVDWHVFSTTDMKHWEDHGVALSLDQLGWATRYAWAPDCAFHNGKYYFYFPTDQDFIGVAVSDKPYGPFTDPIKKPLITRQTPGVIANRDLIDPTIFIDDDNTPYLYFGQNHVNMVRLNDDMISFNDSMTIIQGADNFFEAVWMHKYKGKYYLSYSGKGQILYCMGDSPYGPFEYKGVILDRVNSGTNHHSIVEYKGQWYLFYHNSNLFLNSDPPEDEKRYKAYRRSICVDYLHYNQDGTIQQVIPTMEGVKEIK